jgi:hypothetical protein
MIITLNRATEDQLRKLQKEVASQTGVMPQSVSLIVDVVLQWALESMKESTLRELGPRMLTLQQQRKAVISEMLAFKEQLDQPQLKKMMKTLKKLKKSALKTEESSSNNST